MAKVLVIEAYLGWAENQKSLLLYAQKKFLDAYKQLHPADEIVYLDLNQETKLETVLTTKNINCFWDAKSQHYINLITQTDKIIISTNMINFTISPILRNFFDNILIPEKTFSYDNSGKSCGLLNPQIKAQLILVQGDVFDAYPFANFDGWLKQTLHFMGIEKIQVLLFDGANTKEQAILSLEEKFALKEWQFNQQVKEF